MAKKLQYTISADNSPAIQAMSELSLAVAKLNNSFKAINQAQKAAAKDKAAGSKTMLDPDELNAIGGHLNNVNDIIKTIGTSQQQWQRDAGFKGLKEGFDGVSTSVKGLFGDVTALLTPIEALTGAGVIAGLAKVANSFNSNSTKNKTVTYETGMSPSDSQRFVNRAGEFGIDSDSARAGLTSFSQLMRDAAIHGGPLLQTLQNQLGIQDVGAERVNTPGKLQGLLEETMTAINRYGSEHPSMRKSMIDQFGLTPYEPMMMAPPDVYQQQIAKADKLYVPSDKDTEKGYLNDLKMNDFMVSMKSFWNKAGSFGSDFMGGLAEGWAKTFRGESAAIGQQGLMNIDPDGLDRVRKLFHGDFSANNWSFMAQNKKESQDGRVLGDNEPSGIGIDAAPPPQKVDINIQFDNAPQGMKVTTSPDSVVRVRPNVNYSGFGQ